MVLAPNGQIFSQPLINYTCGIRCIWNEICARLTLGNNWEKAKVLLQEIAQRRDAQLDDEEHERIRQEERSELDWVRES